MIKKCSGQWETEEDREAEESSLHEALANVTLGMVYLAHGLETLLAVGFMHTEVFGV